MACSLIPVGYNYSLLQGIVARRSKANGPDGTPVFVKYEMPLLFQFWHGNKLPQFLSANREAGMGHRVEQKWLNGRTLERQDHGEVNRCVRFWCACTILVFC